MPDEPIEPIEPIIPDDTQHALVMVTNIRAAMANAGGVKSSKLGTAGASSSEFENWPYKELREELIYWESQLRRLQLRDMGTPHPRIGLHRPFNFN